MLVDRDNARRKRRLDQVAASRGPLIGTKASREQPGVEARRDFGVEAADGGLSTADTALREVSAGKQEVLLGFALGEARVAAHFPIETVVTAAQRGIKAEAERRRGELVIGRRGQNPTGRDRDGLIRKAGVAQPRLHAIAELVGTLRMRQRQA